MVFFDKLKKKGNRVQLILQEYRNIPGFNTLLETINIKDDIDAGKIPDDALEVVEDGKVIKIEYNIDGSSNRKKTLEIDASSGQRIDCKGYNYLDTQNCIAMQQYYDPKSKVEFFRRVVKQVGENYTEKSFRRDLFKFENVEYSRREYNTKNFTRVSNNMLDISLSPSDISSLDACMVNDSELYDMSKLEPNFDRVKNKILESTNKDEICSYIASKNQLKRTKIEPEKLYFYGEKVSLDELLGLKTESAEEMPLSSDEILGLENTRRAKEKLDEVERLANERLRLKQWKEKWIDGYDTPGEQDLKGGIEAIERLLKRMYGDNFQNVEDDEMYKHISTSRTILQLQYNASKERRLEKQTIEDEKEDERNPDPVFNLPTKKTLSELSIETIQELKNYIQKSNFDEKTKGQFEQSLNKTDENEYDDDDFFVEDA